MVQKQPLVELHAHLGASINPAILWSIAHENGIKLPTKDYWEFADLVVLSDDRKTTLKDYLDNVYHPILDPISSGTFAVEKAVHETIGGAYRSSHIAIHELRLNPMKHNNRGKQDLDHIIMAAIRGMERALLEYPQIQAGLILCMDRHFSYEMNEIIAEKAIKYSRRGIVGVDFANYNKKGFSFKPYAKLIERCRKSKLGVTVHTGETADTDDMWDVLRYIHPDRIGHGIRSVSDKKLMKALVSEKITLEVCPLSNLVTQAIADLDELKYIVRTLIENDVLITINTDWPETIRKGHLTEQFSLLLRNGILTQEEADRCTQTARDATFTKSEGLSAYL